MRIWIPRALFGFIGITVLIGIKMVSAEPSLGDLYKAANICGGHMSVGPVLDGSVPEDKVLASIKFEPLWDDCSKVFEKIDAHYKDAQKRREQSEIDQEKSDRDFVHQMAQ